MFCHLYFFTLTDCCSIQEGASKYQVLFSAWENLLIRLHFMRCCAVGCTRESHPLYPVVFMVSLSRCIFEWDQEDLDVLYAAKKAELSAIGVRYEMRWGSENWRNTVGGEQGVRRQQKHCWSLFLTLWLVQLMFLASPCLGMRWCRISGTSRGDISPVYRILLKLNFTP